jgi:glycyl-tRNA synthetase
LNEEGRRKYECPECHEIGALTDPRLFNLMFESHTGAVQDEASKVYLRPETAQGIFANFKNVLDTSRVKVPFGIAQIGKAFRNEINPRNYTFRSREFEQMEIEFFCREDDSMQWYEFWRKVRYDWYVGLGLKSEKLRLRDQTKEELAHYSRACADIEYLFPFSEEFQELEGVAHRGNFDLTQHQKFSGKDLSYFDDETKQRFLPHVIEPSAGVDRFALAVLCEAYHEQQIVGAKGTAETRVFMRFHPRLAPIKAAVFPLVKRDGMPEVARAIYEDVRRHHLTFYDEKGAIGRRYARQDEAGTPFCFTIDGQTLQDGTVTVRWRDTLEQERIDKSRCLDYLRDKLAVGGM